MQRQGQNYCAYNWPFVFRERSVKPAASTQPHRAGSIKARSFALTILLCCGFVSGSAIAQLPDFTELVDENVSSVVHITVVSEGGGMLQNLRRAIPEEWLERRDFFPWLPEEEPLRRGQGSGFIISPDGYILTNNHVASQGSDITVRLHDRREFKAELIGADARSDIAVLKVDADDLPAARQGDSGSLKVGQWVFAIGSPFNFEYSVTAGIVSALGRSLPSGGLQSYVPFIQSDVAINPGNSGGPLFDLDGRVVGINSQIFSRSGAFQGLAFSIPIDVAMEVVAMLREDGEVSRGYLGVALNDGVSHDVAKSLGLDRPRGALVTQVVEDTPAEEAGLEAGDVILSVDGEPVERSNDLPFIIGRRKSGDEVELGVWRDEDEITLKATLALLEEEASGASGEQENEGELTSEMLGLSVASIPEDVTQRLGFEGVVVRSSNGLARAADILRGDLIIEIDGVPIRDRSDFEEAVEELEPGDYARFLVVRGPIRTYRAIRVPG